MKGIIKKILREFDDFEWAEETIESGKSPYEMSVPELTNFLNGFFNENLSPKLGRKYVCVYDPEYKFFSLGDYTGKYISDSEKEISFQSILDNLQISIDAYKHSDNRYDIEIKEEFQDLYDTLKPLIKGNINESDDFEWAEEVIDNTASPYLMNVPELTKFLNNFFDTHSSPRFGRYYQCKFDKYWMVIEDHTGQYTNVKHVDKPFNILVNKIKDTLNKYESRDETDREIYLEYMDLYDTLRPLIKGHINESDEFGWTEELINESDPYDMNPHQLASFLDTFFKSHPSEYGITYQCYIDEDNQFFIGPTPNDPYVYINGNTANFEFILRYIYEPIVKPLYRDIADDYRDLYNTLRPLIKEYIREQAEDMDWFNIDDMPEPKGIALANLIEQYFKDNELPYYVSLRKDNGAIYISDLLGDYVVEDTHNFTIDRIISSIQESLIATENSHYYDEYLEFYKDIQPLFDTFK